MDTLFDLPESLSPTEQWLAACREKGVVIDAVDVYGEPESGPKFIAYHEDAPQLVPGIEGPSDNPASTPAAAVTALWEFCNRHGSGPMPFQSFDAWRLDQMLKAGR